MRILYLTPGCFDKGGISRYSRYQISALREIYGDENVRVLSLLGPDKESLEEDFEVYYFVQSVNKNLSTGDRILFALSSFKNVLFWRPDVIHFAHVNLSPLSTRLAWFFRSKTVLNVYGLEIWSGLSKRRQVSMFKTDYIISDCHFTASYVKDNNLHPKDPIVIWDCVDLLRFSPRLVSNDILEKYGVPNAKEHFLIVSLGRLAIEAAHKGFDRLIENVALLINEYPHVRLVIAGRGSDMPRLKILAAQLGIKKYVIFTGSVDENDLAEIYSCADVFSLVSDRGLGRGEGIPLTPLEAMACGVPVIVGNEDGSQEAVVDDRNGFVVSPLDEVSHCSAFKRLIDEPNLHAKMSRNAQLVAKEYFSYDQFVAKHRALYEQILPLR